MFFFYAIAFLPFSVMAVALCLGPHPRRRPSRRPADGRRRSWSAPIVALVAANFAYLYPILTDELLPYPTWLSRMWFKTWI